jgi:D-glycero-alpha-D-manno-heptose-7-phosphate kinase
MIITRSPLRVSLGGGGTDLPSYYREHGPGFLIAAAIDKYVYITIHDTFDPGVIVKYSKMERVNAVSDVEHPIVREAMRFAGIENPHLEVTSMADIPAGTGLGSSSSFTTALLKALHAYRKNLVHPEELAAQACDIEINRLCEPLGKQDQYIAAFGGVTCFRFHADERVEAWPLRASTETLHSLEDNLMLFFTGFTRSASSLLRDQDEKTKRNDSAMLKNMEFVKELGVKSLEALESGDLHGFAELMNVHWEHKRRRTNGMSNYCIDIWYNTARQNGALGGKLIGAGGGGFLLFYTEDRSRLRHAMTQCGVREVRFRFDFEGTKILTT